jgi:hypothetical protein
MPQGLVAVAMAQPSSIVRLGQNIRIARLRRNWRLDDLAARDVEMGKPGTSMAASLSCSNSALVELTRCTSPKPSA